MYIQSDGYTWYIQGYTMYIPCISLRSTSTYTWYIPGIYRKSGFQMASYMRGVAALQNAELSPGAFTSMADSDPGHRKARDTRVGQHRGPGNKLLLA
jgi:hypothetical protein